MTFAGVEGPSPDAEQSWKLYLPLWAALISSKSHGADEGADGNDGVSAWEQPTYDALMSAVLDALRNLELNYQHERSMEPAAHAGKAVNNEEVNTPLQAFQMVS